jgi:predicted DNA-binding protein
LLKTVRKTIRVPERLQARLLAEKERTGVPIAESIRRALAAYLKRPQ